ncbi:MAG: rod shape-determining protein MreD [Clostridia bacterium]
MEKILKVIVTIFLFVISLAIQLFLFDNMSLFGVKPNMLLISIIVVSLYTNIYASTIYSFSLGFIVDLIFGGSGMFTISYTIIGMLLGLISEDYMKENYLSTIVLTALSVIVFEVILYFDSMIISSSYISFFFLIKQLTLSILLNVVLVFIMCFLFGKIIIHIDKKQNRIYW